MSDDDLLSVEAAAALLGIKVQSLYRQAHHGRIVPWERGPFRFRRADVLAYQDQHSPTVARRCRWCGKRLPDRPPGVGGPPRLTCNAACRARDWRRRSA